MDFNDDLDALMLLHDRGYHEFANGRLEKPCADHLMKPDELEAVRYLIEEWDFEGVIR